MTSLKGHQPAGALASALRLPETQPALDWIGLQLEHFVEELVRLSEIPAPTFAEGKRAEYVANRLRTLGLTEIGTDAVGNVTGSIASELPGAGTAFIAHLDTVFPAETNVHVTRQDGRLHGPGIGDNGAGLVGVLLMLEAMAACAVKPKRPLWIVASTGEEGLGDLCGARAAVETLRPRLNSVVAVEGALLGRVTHQAVGSLRWHVRFRGPGGHSWHDFGRPSAINAAACAVAELTRIQVPADPRATFNVGRIEGGIGVNVIASDASFLLDMRSVDPAALIELTTEAERRIRATAKTEGADVEIETVGDRPAGSIPRNSAIVEIASDVLRHLGIEPRYEAASTDANIPLSRNIAAITVGVTHGAGVHTEAEWIEIAPALTGVAQLLLLAVALTEEGGTDQHAT